jgi:hypothetical protein
VPILKAMLALLLFSAAADVGAILNVYSSITIEMQTFVFKTIYSV